MAAKGDDKSRAVETRGGGGGQVDDKLEMHRLQAQALEWKCQGRTLRWIAEQQGVSVGTAANRVQRGLQALYPKEQVDHYRAYQLAEYNATRKVVWAIIVDAEESRTGRLDAIDRLLRLMAQEAKLLGLNMPEVIEQRHSGGIISVEVEASVQALVGEILELADANGLVLDVPDRKSVV